MSAGIRVVHQVGVARCGFCATNNHEKCPGGVRNGVGAKSGAIVRCQCGCGYNVLRCLDCKNPKVEDIDPETWSCLDKDACAVRVQHRLDTNPAVAQIRQIKERHDMARTDTLAQRRAARAATKPATKVEPATKAAKEPKECGCGCETLTGGNFAPGHDARFISGLVKEAQATKSEVKRGQIRKRALAYSEALAGKFDKSMAAQAEKAEKAAKAAEAAAEGKPVAKKAAAKKAAPAPAKAPAKAAPARRKAKAVEPEPEPEEIEDDEDLEFEDEDGDDSDEDNEF